MIRLMATAIGCATLAVAAVAAAEPPVGAVSCSGCHPSSARVASPIPRLAGRDKAELAKAMLEFRSGARTGTVMDRIAKGFTDDEIQAIAAWYAAQQP